MHSLQCYKGLCKQLYASCVQVWFRSKPFLPMLSVERASISVKTERHGTETATFFYWYCTVFMGIFPPLDRALLLMTFVDVATEHSNEENSEFLVAEAMPLNFQLHLSVVVLAL